MNKPDMRNKIRVPRRSGKTFYSAAVLAFLMMVFAAADNVLHASAASAKSIKSGETWVVSKTTTLTALVIAEGAVIKAPEGHSVTLTVDGTETEIHYGTFKGRIAITVDKKS